MAVLIIGATTVVTELQSALDRIWEVPCEDRPSGLMGLLRTRLVAFGLVLGLGFLALVTLILSAGVAAFGAWFGEMFEGWEALLQALNLTISVALSAGLFAMIYKLMPSVPIAWRDVWIGAVVTAVLFEIGKILIGLYIGKSGVTSGFGAAGSHRAARVGLLLGADLPAGRRVYLGLCAPSGLARDAASGGAWDDDPDVGVGVTSSRRSAFPAEVTLPVAWHDDRGSRQEAYQDRMNNLLNITSRSMPLSLSRGPKNRPA